MRFALKGGRALLHRPDKRGKNVTLIGAMGLKGIVGSMTLFSVEQIP